MKMLLTTISIILFVLAIITIFKVVELKNIKYSNPEFLSSKNTLIVYYSNGGNTKSVAQKLHDIIGGDIKEIQLKETYPKNLFTMSKIIRKQIKQGYLPDIEKIDISSYDVIFVCSPIWNFSISLPIKSFLTANNFENKTIIPCFTYSGGANKNKIIKEIKDLTKAKDITKPLFMFENGIILTEEQIKRWLNNI